MSGILFDEIIFGPLQSRRFGVSLGINLLPLDSKLCSFNCVYCECGLTDHAKGHKPRLFTREQILGSLEQRFIGLHGNHVIPDSITFAGNGEPTMHPEFESIIDGVVELRDEYFPQAMITVLSNATQLNRDSVRSTLGKVDNNVLKLDAGTDALFQAINRPLNKITLEEVVKRLVDFEGDLTIQTLFVRGKVHEGFVDNTLETEIIPWLGFLERISPKLVMLYPIDRRTPYTSLEKITEAELASIAGRVEKIGLKAEIFS